MPRASAASRRRRREVEQRVAAAPRQQQSDDERQARRPVLEAGQQRREEPRQAREQGGADEADAPARGEDVDDARVTDASVLAVQHDLDPPVLFAALGGGVGRDRVGVGAALRADPRRVAGNARDDRRAPRWRARRRAGSSMGTARCGPAGCRCSRSPAASRASFRSAAAMRSSSGERRGLHDCAARREHRAVGDADDRCRRRCRAG